MILTFLTVKMMISLMNTYVDFTNLIVILNEMIELRINKLKKLKNKECI